MTALTPTRKPLIRRLLALTAGAALVGGVAACSPENVAERAIEAGAGGNVDVDIDDESGQVTIDDGEGGSATFGDSGDLRDGFPDAVPVVKDTIGFTQSMTDPESGDTFTVFVPVSGDPADVWDQVKADLDGAGFTLGNETTITNDGEAYYAAVFTSAAWDVSAGVSSADGESHVAYIVTTATA